MSISTNIFKRFLELLPSDPLLVGDVTGVDGDTATVAFAGGGSIRVRNPQGLDVDSRVFVQGSVITGAAPDLDSFDIEI